MTDDLAARPAAITMPVERDHPFDPPAELRQLRGIRPVSRLTFPDGTLGWLVTSHALGRQVLADPRFSARSDLRSAPVVLPLLTETREQPRPGWFVRMDPPEHTRYRRLLTGQFTVRRMNQLTPRITEVAQECLDTMARQGPPADLVHAYALPIPSMVICELLGVPYADRARFQENTRMLAELNSTREQFFAAMGALDGYLHELVLAKRAAPTDDLLSGLVTSGQLTDEELVNLSTLLLIAGHETTANMLALGTFALLSHPDQLAALRAAPSLIDGAVEELLRYLSIVHIGLTRAALEDVPLGDVLVRAGETVVLAMNEANRDTGFVADPDRLDITRAAGGHLAFGHGLHQCLGQQLARVEMRIGFTALLARFPGLRLAVPPEEVPMRTNMAIYGVDRLPVTW